MTEPAFIIRSAERPDAPQIASLLRRSITELCRADYEGAPGRLDGWLANKTADTALAWMAGPGVVLVAGSPWNEDTLQGVGMGLPDAEIVLNYVHPDARFKGVSKAIVTALEDYFSARGQMKVHLQSTRTAERFYRSMGYRPVTGTDAPGPLFFEKELQP